MAPHSLSTEVSSSTRASSLKTLSASLETNTLYMCYSHKDFRRKCILSDWATPKKKVTERLSKTVSFASGDSSLGMQVEFGYPHCWKEATCCLLFPPPKDKCCL